MSYHSFHPSHNSDFKCFQCKQGQYVSYYKDGKTGWSLPERDTVQCNKCGHICESYLTVGDIVVDDRAIVKDTLPVSLKDCEGSIDHAMKKFERILELSKAYFAVFVDENDNDDPVIVGFRLEDNEERARRRIDLISQKLSEENTKNAERQKRYARYLLLKEKFDV